MTQEESRAMFNVTYEIIDPESAADGESDERGFIAENVSLRDAVRYVHETRTNAVSGVWGIETDSYQSASPRWVTVTNGLEYLTGAQECRSLHIPENVTAASARRIARLVGARI